MVLFWVTGEGFVGIYYSGVSRTILPRYQWSTLLVRAGIDLARSRGATHLDMLRGEHEYKLQWASDVVPSRRLVLGRGTVAWSCYAGHLVARRRLERFVLSERCPPAVRNAARAVRNAAVAARRHLG
jgi:CelD/BcsL family acetyltransferase involved in cellulose biosynthesis